MTGFQKLVFASFLIGSFAMAEEASTQFKAVLKAVVEQAASIQVQRSVVDSAREQRRAKSLYWTPTGSLALTNQLDGLIPVSGNTSLNGTLATINLNILKFGSNELARQAAVAHEQAESSRLSQVQENLESEVAGLIFQLIEQRQDVQIRKGHVEIQRQSLDVAQERYRRGQLAEQELDKAKVDMESSKVSLAEAELAQVQTLNSIQTLADVDTKIMDWPLTERLNIGAKSKNQRRRAVDFYNVKALASDEDSFHKNAQQIWRSSYLPSLDLSGGWNAPGDNPFVSGQWYAGLTLTIPLWDQWAGVAQAQEMESNSRASKANLQQSVRQAQAALNTLDLRLQLAQQNVESSTLSVHKLQSLRNDSLRRFRLGRSTVNDFLIDETRYLDAENSLQTSMLAYHQLMVEACHDQQESLLNCF